MVQERKMYRWPRGTWIKCSIVNHQRNANQKHSEILSHSCQNSWHKKVYESQMLRMWRKGDPSTPEELPWWLGGKESACQCSRSGFDPWVSKIPWGGKGFPLQYSCLENPMGKGGWWAIVHEITSVRHDLATKPQQHTVDGYVNWYSHYVKQHDIPKKRKTRNKTTIWSGSSNTGSTSEKKNIYMYI